MTLSTKVVGAMNKGFVESLEKGRKLMKIFNFTNELIYDIVSFCSDGRRTKKNKIIFTKEKLKEYREHIKNAKPVNWTRYKPLGKQNES